MADLEKSLAEVTHIILLFFEAETDTIRLANVETLSKEQNERLM